MQAEAGLSEADAGGEVRRCIQTLRASGEEGRRLAGDVIPLEGAPQREGRLAFTLWVPVEVVGAGTPFSEGAYTGGVQQGRGGRKGMGKGTGGGEQEGGEG